MEGPLDESKASQGQLPEEGAVFPHFANEAIKPQRA